MKKYVLTFRTSATDADILNTLSGTRATRNRTDRAVGQPTRVTVTVPDDLAGKLEEQAEADGEVLNWFEGQ